MDEVNSHATTIGIVIVSYNSAQELPMCIKAAKAGLARVGRGIMIVVDNDSKDQSVTISKKLGAEVIANKENRGFAAAVNQGMHLAKGRACDYFLILNPDVTMQPDALFEMLKIFKNHKSAGAVGPNLLDKKGRLSPEGYYWKTPSWISVSLFSTFLQKYFIHWTFFVKKFYRETNLENDRPVQQIPGACLLTSKAVIDKVGQMDEDYAIWFEDVDWSYRARRAGFQLWFCAEAKVIHEGGTSFERWRSLDKAVTFYVSMKTFFNKHKPLSGVLVRLALVLNSLTLFIKNRDGSNLVFIKRFLLESRGRLPD